MKKMIIVAALVCAATLVKGAAIEWSLTSVAKSETTDLATGAMIGYFMDGSTWDAFSALTSDKVAEFVTAKASNSGLLQVSRNKGTVSGTFGNVSPKDTVTGYLVIFDNANASDAGFYANSAFASAEVPDVGNLKFTESFTSSTGWQKIGATPGPTPGPVPEPTSGLLLVLGGAALALRRRR